MTVLMEGMLAVQAGAPPQFVNERLRALVSERPSARSGRKARTSAAEETEQAS